MNVTVEIENETPFSIEIVNGDTIGTLKQKLSDFDIQVLKINSKEQFDKFSSPEYDHIKMESVWNKLQSPIIIARRKQKPVEKKLKKKEKKQKVYVLFKASEFGNSDDYLYELNYAFRGTYSTKEKALQEFVDTVIGEDESFADEFFDHNDNLKKNVESKMEVHGWKLIESELE